MSDQFTDFACAICQRTICMRWNYGKRDKIIPPICNICEQHYSSGYGCSVKDGSFRDRREVTRGLALAEALRCEAATQQWRVKYAA